MPYWPAELYLGSVFTPRTNLIQILGESRIADLQIFWVVECGPGILCSYFEIFRVKGWTNILHNIYSYSAARTPNQALDGFISDEHIRQK